MRKTLSLIIPLFLSSICFSQPLILEWQNCFGGTYDDKAFDLVRTEDGYLIAAYWELRDVWLIKTDLTGGLIWEKKMGGSEIEGPKRIYQLDDGNYVLICASYSSDGDIEYDPYPESNEYWVVKVNGSGDIIWEKLYGGSCIEQIWDGIVTADNGIIALGHTCSDDGDISTYFGTWDTWMIKLDTDGNKIWDFTMGTEDFDLAAAIIETSDHGFLLSSGSTPTTGGNIDCEPFNYNAEIILFKLDSMANIEWQQCYGGSGHDQVQEIVETSDGYLLACIGSTNDGDLTGSGYHLGYYPSGAQTSDIWLLKIDFNGNILWSKCYGGTRSETAHRVFKTNDHGFLIFGEAASFDGDVTGNHSAGPDWSDIWVIKIDSIGQIIWQQCIGGQGDENIESGVINNGDGSYVIASTMDSYNAGQIECSSNTSSKDVWLIQVRDTTVVSVHEKPLVESLMKVYPNPADEYVIFEEVGNGPGTSRPGNPQAISITDIYGRAVAQIPVTAEKTVWDARGVKPGVYLYHLQTPDGNASGKILISP